MRKLLIVIDMQNDFIDAALGTKEAQIYEKPTFGSMALAADLKRLSENEAIELELIGLCTDICVVSNALLLKAAMPEVKISVDAACCAGVTPEKHASALETMRSCQIQVINGAEICHVGEAGRL